MKFSPVIKYSGSKRTLSQEIINFFPNEIDCYYEPFLGSGSIMFQLLHSTKKVNRFVCSDINSDVISFFNILKQNPDEIITEYSKRWSELIICDTIIEKREYYNKIRKCFNQYKNVHDFVFLSRTCNNGLIRYNKNGEFNTSFHLTRNGIDPKKYKIIIYDWSSKLNQMNVEFYCHNYFEIKPTENDFVFLDPPYFNTKNMYYGVIDFDYFWNFLINLKCNYCFTFDGKRTDKDCTFNVPDIVYSRHLYLTGTKSSFKKLKNKKDIVNESLYLNDKY